MLGLQQPNSIVVASTNGYALALKIINSIILIMELVGIFFGSYASGATWMNRIVHLIIPVVGIIAAHYRHIVLLRVFATLAALGIALVVIFVALAIVSLAAIYGAAGSEAYAASIALLIVLVIFSGITMIFDIVNLILAVKLVKRIRAAETNYNLYDMQQFGASEPHPQPVQVAQAPVVYPYATQNPQQAMPYMTTVPAGATMVPMGTMAPMYSPQQMGVVYTQPYAIPPTLTQ
eukprot:TRINITY_DN2887_c0_g2_i1.p1 TRINITY_DN2887_c0_g2~~TRINITY_DN2887_c0_g2_i1.p1  ORF type:complete len:234 (+),score=49.31 TRINITY_DN2887_c0_g2_i1:53-754(+)